MAAASNRKVRRTIFLHAIAVALCAILAGKTVSAVEQIDQSNLPEWAGGWTHVNPAGEGQATMWQTFTPACTNMIAVEIDILTVSPGRGDDVMTVEIAKDGEILASAERSVEDGFDGLLRFEFPEAAPLVPEQVYALTVRDTGKTLIGWKYGPNTYERGSRYVFAEERPGTDWLFRTYSKVEPAGTKYSGGTGEPNDPYQIATAADLIALCETSEDYYKHFILTADIDMDPNLPGRKVFYRGVIGYHLGRGIIGPAYPFTGVFDGNGHTISNLTMAGQDFLGLFGSVGSSAEVKNLGVVNVNIDASDSHFGDVGGLVGSNAGKITASYSTGIVSVDRGYIGGLVGHNSGSITASYSTATVNGGRDYIGGLVGNNDEGYITMSYSTGAVTGGYAVGGLVGRNIGETTNCYSTSTVSGNNSIGGLVGTNHDSDMWGEYPGIVSRCYSTGEVSGTGYSTDEVNGTGVGGLVGSNKYFLEEGGVVRHSFWDTETSCQATSYGGTGLATA